MTTAEITDQIMALPPAERVAIAQEIWHSLEAEEATISPESDAEAVYTARQRDQELSRGEVPPRAHNEVMRSARRAIG